MRVLSGGLVSCANQYSEISDALTRGVYVDVSSALQLGPCMHACVPSPGEQGRADTDKALAPLIVSAALACRFLDRFGLPFLPVVWFLLGHARAWTNWSPGAEKRNVLIRSRIGSLVYLGKRITLFAWLISHQPAVLFSHNKPATSNQPTILFSQNKSAPAISHQPNCHTRFPKGNQVHLICAPGSVHTHMIDKNE
jgi:hypothetical protein